MDINKQNQYLQVVIKNNIATILCKKKKNDTVVVSIQIILK